MFTWLSYQQATKFDDFYSSYYFVLAPLTDLAIIYVKMLHGIRINF